MRARIAAADHRSSTSHGPEQTDPTTGSNRSGEWRRKGVMASAAAGAKESRREASWKDPEGRVISATTRADAAARLDELHDHILAICASFADLAAQHSARPPAAGLRQRADHAMADSGLLGDG
ncbi:hypothetical protein ACQJBY_068267 [Aegilops geniculata]